MFVCWRLCWCVRVFVWVVWVRVGLFVSVWVCWCAVEVTYEGGVGLALVVAKWAALWGAPHLPHLSQQGRRKGRRHSHEPRG